MDKAEWACVQCGDCCKRFGWSIHVSDEDLKRWERENRHDILDRVAIVRDKKGEIMMAEGWFNPITRREYIYCPFLKQEKGKWFCKIHDTKPEMCTRYICRKYRK